MRILRKKCVVWTILTLLWAVSGLSQQYLLPEDQERSQKIRFQLVQGLKLAVGVRQIFGGLGNPVLELIAAEGYRVEVVPAMTGPTEILGRSPAGVFVSNGPGDPAAVPEAADATDTAISAGRSLPARRVTESTTRALAGSR